MSGGLIDLGGKVCLVTGASRGIGLASARLFAEHGATVLLVGRDRDRLDAACGELRAAHGAARADWFVCDVASEEHVKALFQAVFRRPERRLDVMMANAGVVDEALIGMVSQDQMDRVFSVNTFGLLHCAQYASRMMARSGRGGSIVNVTSIVGVQGLEGLSVYSGSKAAVIGVTKSLAKELAPQQIRVNAIAPGFIETDMIKHLPETVVARRLGSIRMGRVGAAEDVARAALFLASDLSAYVTGQIIGVDGGMTL